MSIEARVKRLETDTIPTDTGHEIWKLMDGIYTGPEGCTLTPAEFEELEDVGGPERIVIEYIHDWGRTSTEVI